MPPCLTLSIIKIQIKGKVQQSRERNRAFPYTSVVQLLKRKPSGRPRLRSPTFLFVSVIMSFFQHGFPRLFLATRLYRPSHSSDPLDYIRCLHRAAVAGRPTLARPCEGIQRSTSLIRSSLLPQQCPTCLVRQTWMILEMVGQVAVLLLLNGMLLPGFVHNSSQYS